MKQRIFVALELPAAIRHELHRYASAIGAGRIVPEIQMHITLRFAGDASEASVIRFRSLLAGIVPETVRLAATGAAFFPPRARELRGVWVEFEDRSGGALDRLRKKIEVAAIQAGFPPETRPFRPHVTILRFGRGHGPVDLKLDRFGLEYFETSVFTLYESRLTPDGAVYTVLQQYGEP